MQMSRQGTKSRHEAAADIAQGGCYTWLKQAVHCATTARAHMKDGAVEVQPDSVLLSQIVPQLPNLTVDLTHRCNIFLGVCGHCCMQLLDLV